MAAAVDESSFCPLYPLSCSVFRGIGFLRRSLVLGARKRLYPFQAQSNLIVWYEHNYLTHAHREAYLKERAVHFKLSFVFALLGPVFHVCTIFTDQHIRCIEFQEGPWYTAPIRERVVLFWFPSWRSQPLHHWSLGSQHTFIQARLENQLYSYCTAERS